MLNQKSEPDLLVFISSVMDEELNPARDSATATIQGMDFGRPWTFEYTPASSEPAVDSYLRKVEEADFVIWLVGSRTTQPVVNEVHQCLANHGRLLIFKLPASTRDDESETLLAEAGQVAKWKDVDSLATLESEIKMSLHDEMIRALRDPLQRTRTQNLARARDKSLAEGVVPLLALGVGSETAHRLVYEDGVGHDLGELDPGLHVVTGPQGSGKTMAAHRRFQKAVECALKDASAPFPIFINSADISNGLWDAIENRCRGNVDPQAQPLMVIIDAIDERGNREATTLVRQMESYCNANLHATLVATSRPLTDLEHSGTTIQIPLLNDEQLVSLIAYISGQNPEKIDPRLWRHSLRETSRFPLFAIMIGVWLRKNSQVGDLGRHELVEHLGKAALTNSTGDNEETDRLLQILATKAITDGSRVRLHEVTPLQSRQRQLADSRLLYQNDGAIDFALPIFREWYAARAVLEGTVPIQEIDLQSDRWTVPLSIAAHSSNSPMAQSVIEHLASTNPAVASKVLKRDEWHRNSSGRQPLLPTTPVGFGEEIRIAMGAWSAGLGDLFNIVGPVNQTGALATLGVRLGGGWLRTSWNRGSDNLPPVLEFTDNYDPTQFHTDWETRKNWPTVSVGPIPEVELWNWVNTKRSLVENLTKALEQRRLSYGIPDAEKELVWAFALHFSKLGSFYEGPIAVNAVLERINLLPNDSRTTVRTLGGLYVWDEIKAARDYLSRLSIEGEYIICDPWPRSDVPRSSHWVSSRYSDQRLLERTTAIYEAALRIYQAMVERWFKPFARHLRLYQLMPVCLSGRLFRPQQGEREIPWLDWEPVILPNNEPSHVSFMYAPEDEARGFSEHYFDEQRDAFDRLRQGITAEPRLFRTSSAIRHYSRPATELAYGWLHDELREWGWVN